MQPAQKEEEGRKEEEFSTSLPNNASSTKSKHLSTSAIKPILSLDEHLQARTHEFTETKPLKVFCGTWNVNGKEMIPSNNTSKGDGKNGSVGGDDISDWLFPNGPCLSKEDRTDIFAIGFQELVELDVSNVVISSEGTMRGTIYWREKVEECLRKNGYRSQPPNKSNSSNSNNTNSNGGNSSSSSSSSGGGGANDFGDEYVLLAETSLVGLLLLLYCRRSLLTSRHGVKDIRTATLATGIFGVLGNKGGVGVRFECFNHSLCFVCAHLHADRAGVEQRNDDFHSISDNLKFDMTSNLLYQLESSISSSSSAIGSITDSGTPESVAISDHDIVFFFGDFNYRIDVSLSNEDVFSYVDANKIDELLKLDQLNIHRPRGNCFSDYLEGDVTFLPTYKYQQGTDLYERRENKKKRAPAWCDRVLWKVNKVIGARSVSNSGGGCYKAGGEEKVAIAVSTSSNGSSSSSSGGSTAEISALDGSAPVGSSSVGSNSSRTSDNNHKLDNSISSNNNSIGSSKYRKESDSIVKLLLYNRSELRPSDHKPVFSLFSVNLSFIAPTLYRKVLSDVLANMGKLEAAAAPIVSLSQTVLDFGLLDVRSLLPSSSLLPAETLVASTDDSLSNHSSTSSASSSNIRVEKSFSISNISQVPVEWSFIPKLEEDRVASCSAIALSMTKGELGGAFNPGSIPSEVIVVRLSLNKDNVKGVLAEFDAVSTKIDDIDTSAIGDGGGADTNNGSYRNDSGNHHNVSNNNDDSNNSSSNNNNNDTNISFSGKIVTLDEILILRIPRGRDYYISIKASLLT